MGSAGIRGVTRHYVDLGHEYPELFLKQPSKGCILKDVVVDFRISRGETNA